MYLKSSAFSANISNTHIKFFDEDTFLEYLSSKAIHPNHFIVHQKTVYFGFLLATSAKEVFV